MTKVKICGITCLEDALAAVDAGADAVGFVFAESPRRIQPGLAERIAGQLPPFVAVVGVFVNCHADSALLDECLPFLHAIQLHGDEPPEFAKRLPRKRIKSFRVRTSEDLRPIEAYRGAVDAILLDSRVEGFRGGSGQSFDWELARGARSAGIPIVLAGGIGPDNVAAAITEVRPYAVDASTRLESSPGRKDAALVRRFVREVRRADAELG